MLKNVLASLVLVVALSGCVSLPLDGVKSGIVQGVGNYIGEKYTDDVFGATAGLNPLTWISNLLGIK